MYCDRGVTEYAVNLVLSTRSPDAYGMADLAPLVEYGASPRASIGLIRAGRAMALLRGRTYVVPQDVFDVAPEILRHRIVVTYEALAQDISPDQIVSQVTGQRSGPFGPAIRPVGADRRLLRNHGGHPQLGFVVAVTTSTDSGRASSVLRRMEIDVTRRLDGILHGDYTGLVPGHGSEPGEARDYQPGDDVRRIDWSVTARTNSLHVRDTIADRELEAWIIADCSPSLDFGTAEMEKRDLVLAAAAAVGFLTSRGGNRIGSIVSWGGRAEILPARSGRTAPDVDTGPRRPHRTGRLAVGRLRSGPRCRGPAR